MKKHYERLLDIVCEEKPSAELRGKILARIAHERRMLRMRILAFGSLACAAALGFIPAWRELSLEVSRSGFFEFASLAFSDFGTVSSAWRDFALLLAESFPVAGASAVLASVLVLLYSLSRLVRDAGALFRRSRLARI